jgi:hypothetical protein
MIRLIDEVDPKRVNAKHMVGKQILIRDKDEIFMSKVVNIANIPYVYRWGVGYKLDSFDGWSPLPIQEIDMERDLRHLNHFFSED